MLMFVVSVRKENPVSSLQSDIFFSAIREKQEGEKNRKKPDRKRGLPSQTSLSGPNQPNLFSAICHVFCFATPYHHTFQ